MLKHPFGSALVILSIVLPIAVAGGCQTVAGLGRDLTNVADGRGLVPGPQQYQQQTPVNNRAE